MGPTQVGAGPHGLVHARSFIICTLLFSTINDQDADVDLAPSFTASRAKDELRQEDCLSATPVPSSADWRSEGQAPPDAALETAQQSITDQSFLLATSACFYKYQGEHVGKHVLPPSGSRRFQDLTMYVHVSL